MSDQRQPWYDPPGLKDRVDVKLHEKLKAKILLLCPDLFSVGSVLYIGARPGGWEYLREFWEGGAEITVLEAFLPNVMHLKEFPWFNSVLCNDVMYMQPEDFGQSFDYVFWWHGPEHLPKEVVPTTLRLLEGIACKGVLLGCPYGVYKQESIYGNPYEYHLSHLYPEDLIALGYQVMSYGGKNRAGNLIAYKNSKVLYAESMRINDCTGTV